MARLVTKGATDVTDYVFIQDSTSGAPETGVTITDLDIQYVRAGAAPAAKVDATALAAIDSAHGDNKMFEVDGTDQPGLYRIDWPDAMFATGVNRVVGTVKGTGFQPCHVEYLLTDVDLFDSVRGGMTALPNAAADAAGGLPISDAGGLDLDGRLDAAISSRLAPTTASRTLDVTAGGAAGIDWGNVENQATAVDLSATAIDLCDQVTANDDMRGTDSAALASVCTETRLAELDAANLPAVLDTVAIDVAGLDGDAMRGTDGAYTGTPPTASAIADQVWDEAAAAHVGAGTTGKALTDISVDVAGLDGDAMRGTDGAYTGTPPTATAIADQVWDEAAAGHVGAGTTGKALSDVAVDVAGLDGDAMRGTDSAALASVCTEGRLAELDAANLPADVDTINTATAGLAGAAMRGTDNAALASVCTETRLAELDAANLPTDVDAIGVSTAGLAGEAMRGTDGAYTGTPPTVAAIADGVWDELITDHDIADSAGESLANASSAGDPWSTSLPGAYGVGSAGEILGNWGSGEALSLILSGISQATVTDIPAAIAALNDISAAEVNAEVVDALFVDQIDELTQTAPAATPTFGEAVMLLYMLLRNKATVTATELAIYNDAGTKITTKALADDGTTFTESEMVSGA